MATIRLVPSTYYLSSTSYLSVSNESNMYANTDSTSYGTVTNTRNNSTTSYYIYLRGFNFDDVPSNAVVSNITIKLKAYHSNGNTSTIYGYNGTTQVSAAGSTTALGTSATVKTFTNTTIDWATLKGYGSNFGIRINCRRSNKNNTAYVYIYGAEIEVTYTADTVHVTGVSLNKNSTSIEEGSTETLTATVSPSNATDKTVSWHSSNSSVAAVDSSGVVTAVSAGSATITVTTTDGSYTDTCAVMVTAPVLKQYALTTTLVAGKSYLIADGSSGSVHILSNESNGSGSLKGVSGTVSSGILTVTSSTEAKCLFACSLKDNNNQGSTILMTGSDYLYTDSSNRLRIASYTSSMDGKHWHYKADGKNLLWFFKDGTNNDGYTDTSSTYKYYLTVTSGNFYDAYVSTTSLENTNTPQIFLFEEYTQPSGDPPTITVGTPSRSIISDETGYDQCTCTFQSDLALSQWEARATNAGTTPARGIGLLVESGGSLAANTNATVIVDDEELTNGDGEYTITVYGLSTGGVWSG